MIEHINFPRRIISMRFIAELANTFRPSTRVAVCIYAQTNGTPVSRQTLRRRTSQRQRWCHTSYNYTSRLLYEHNINDPHVKVTIAAGLFAVQGANGYTNSRYRCRSQHERYITAKRKKKNEVKNKWQETRRPSGQAPYWYMT